MDDVDAVQAQIARTMLVSGDWVTARIDGLVYLEKSPFIYWAMATSYKLFGAHDWSARIPVALAAIGLAALTTAMGVWAFGNRAGFYAGLGIATCTGLFLFTRIQIPDVILTLDIALTLWAFLRVLDEDEPHPRAWAIVMAACLGAGLLIKSLVSVLFPVATVVIYLAVTRQLFVARTWKRLHPFTGALIAVAIAAPWHILAMLRNPPYFAWTFHSGPHQYHGFFWKYFINEQVLRFLNRRYPRDYDTVPRLWFWLLHLVWLFPWSVYFPAVAKLSFKPVDREGRMRLLAVIWAGFVMVFFTFSTTQEYYSMPIYPALALLLGSAMAMGGDWVRRGTRVLAVVAGAAAIAVIVILVLVHGVATPGDIASALVRDPRGAKLSMGPMLDLRLQTFAYLRTPLVMAGIAFLIGAIASAKAIGQRAYLGAALMMVLLLHAARVAMVTFDPFLSSEPLAEALMKAPPGELMAQGHYYEYSSVFFYANRTALLTTPYERRQNLEYGANAPGAPHVFIDDREFKNLWESPERVYFIVGVGHLPEYQAIVGADAFQTVAETGAKYLMTNHPLPSAP